MSRDLYVVAYEGDDPSVLNFAIERAKRNDAALHIVHVLEWSPYSFLTAEELAERHKRKKQEVERAEGAILKPAIALAKNAGVEQTDGELRYGSVVDLICEIAKEQKAEMIFVGRAGSGESGFGSRVFGSVTIGLAQVAPVPTVIVP